MEIKYVVIVREPNGVYGRIKLERRSNNRQIKEIEQNTLRNMTAKKFLKEERAGGKLQDIQQQILEQNKKFERKTKQWVIGN